MALSENKVIGKAEAFGYSDRLGLETAALYVGPAHKPFIVHKKLLTSQSVFFDKALSGEFREAAESIVHLEEDDPAAIALMVAFVYTGSIPGTERPPTPFQKSLWVPSSAAALFFAPGTASPTYRATVTADSSLSSWGGRTPIENHLSISYMPEYSDYSPEELRITDYRCGRRYGTGTQPPFGPLPVINMPTTTSTQSSAQVGSAGVTSLFPASQLAQSERAPSVSPPVIESQVSSISHGLFTSAGPAAPTTMGYRASGSFQPHQTPHVVSSTAGLAPVLDSAATDLEVIPSTTSSVVQLAQSMQPVDMGLNSTEMLVSALPYVNSSIASHLSSNRDSISSPWDPIPKTSSSLASPSSTAQKAKLRPIMSLTTSLQASACSQPFGYTNKIYYPLSPGAFLTGIPRCTSLGELTEIEDAFQLSLLRLSVFAEKCCWAKLYNAAIEGYISGELSLYRPLPVEHIDIIYKKAHGESTLRVFVLDSLGRLDDRDVLDGYLVLAKKYEEFMEEVILRAVSRNQEQNNNDPWGGSGDGEVPLTRKYYMYEADQQ